MRCFDVTPEGSRRKFRKLVWDIKMEPEKYIIQADKLAEQWLTHDKRARQMKEKIVVEHILNQLPREMRTWIGRQQPSNSHELADLMQTFLLVKEKPNYEGK